MYPHTLYMTTKSPFEIRADLVKLAQDHLESSYQANLDFAQETFATMVKNGTETMGNMSKYMPKYFDTDAVLAKAKEFYSFVSTK